MGKKSCDQMTYGETCFPGVPIHLSLLYNAFFLFYWVIKPSTLPSLWGIWIPLWGEAWVWLPCIIIRSWPRSKGMLLIMFGEVSKESPYSGQVKHCHMSWQGLLNFKVNSYSCFSPSHLNFVLNLLPCLLLKRAGSFFRGRAILFFQVTFLWKGRKKKNPHQSLMGETTGFLHVSRLVEQ